MYQQSRSFTRSYGGPVPPEFNNLPRLEFVLTAPNGDLHSQQVLLNGHLLDFNGTALPQLIGIAGTTSDFVVPPQSYGFAVYSDADATACPDNGH